MHLKMLRENGKQQYYVHGKIYINRS